MRTRLFAAFAVSLAAFAAGHDLWKYLPVDAAAVSGVDVERTKNSPFGRYLMEQIAREERGFDELQAATGFDPRRDLRTVIVAARPGGNQALLAAHGAFDPARILAAARNAKGAILAHEGLNVVASNDGEHWIAFPDATSVLAGPAELVRAAIAQAKNPPPRSYLAKAQSLEARYDAWVISTDPAGGLLKGIPANQNGDLLRSIRQAAGGVKYGIYIEIEANATARSERDATALHDAIRFIAGMIRVKSEEAGAVSTLLESMRLSATGEQVAISLRLPEVEIEKLIDTTRSRTRRVAHIY